MAKGIPQLSGGVAVPEPPREGGHGVSSPLKFIITLISSLQNHPNPELDKGIANLLREVIHAENVWAMNVQDSRTKFTDTRNQASHLGMEVGKLCDWILHKFHASQTNAVLQESKSTHFTDLITKRKNKSIQASSSSPCLG